MSYNLVIGIILFVLSLLIGFEISKKYTFRSCFFNDFNDFNQTLSSEIAFTKTTIPEVIKKNYSKKSDFYQILSDYFVDKKQISFEVSYLSKRENAFFNEYLTKIGKYDSSSSAEYLSGIDKLLKSMRQDAINEEEKNKPLCIKLSFMIGLVLLIALL